MKTMTAPERLVSGAAAATPVTATLNVTINQFRPLGAVFPISATLDPVALPPWITVREGNIFVKSDQPATLVFQLTSPAYVFTGVAFNANAATPDVGVREFPDVIINRNPDTKPGNCLTVTDANNPENRGKPYNYLLLVQDTGTGEIGLIDPAIVNEGGP